MLGVLMWHRGCLCHDGFTKLPGKNLVLLFLPGSAHCLRGALAFNDFNFAPVVVLCDFAPCGARPGFVAIAAGQCEVFAIVAIGYSGPAREQ